MTTITPFTMTNYDAVIALWELSDGVGLSSADEPENIHSYLERNPGMSFVAKQDDIVVGAVLGGHDGRRGYIHHLAVHPDYRRQGIGQQLIDRCFGALRAIGIQKCHLFIFKENHIGIAFWKGTGWSYREDIAIMSKMVEGEWQTC
jgi:ribosomal protein S18 acetylase RimI-like enzyme